jgi:hypothetical protein
MGCQLLLQKSYIAINLTELVSPPLASSIVQQSIAIPPIVGSDITQPLGLNEIMATAGKKGRKHARTQR